MFKPVQFGKYYLTDRIAVGGMAEIFKAKLYGVGGFEKPMVVKQILPQYARNAEFIKMFIDEAKIAVSLAHGNIIPVYELGRTDGVYFIAMEYVDGKNLAEILEEAAARDLPLSVEHAIYVAIEICKGLDYAHRHVDAEGHAGCVVHRDVSPPNVMISFAGEVKLADFGIAKAQHKMATTEAGAVKGTHGYMSPEQVTAGRVDHRTDIFSCGILLHEMLTGQRLFAGDNEVEVIERLRDAVVLPPSAFAMGTIPSTLDAIVVKTLARDPADRFQSANELQLALSRELFGSSLAASATTLTRYLDELFPRAARHSERGQALSVGGPQNGGAAARGGDNATQSYAMRDIIKALEEPSQRLPTSARQHRVGGAAVPVDATAGLPPLQEALEPLPDRDEVGAEAEKTAVFRRSGPEKPDVPELRFSVKSGLSRVGQRGAPGKPELFGDTDVSEALDALKGSGEEEEGVTWRAPLSRRDHAASAAAPAGQPSGNGTQRVAAPHDELAPGPGAAAPRRPATAPAPAGQLDPSGAMESVGSGAAPGHSGLMALLTRQPTDEQASVSSSSPSISSLDEAPINAGAPRRGSTGALSMTMRLFLHGLEEDPLGADASSSLDVVPRTIKPTVLGWALIILIVLGAALFVVYKKTTLFMGDDAGSSSSVLGDVDLTAPDAGPKKPLRGTISLAVDPPGAHILLHGGDAPATLEVDTGVEHVLRVEREGYRTEHHVVKPADFAGGKATVHVVCAPVGVGAKDDDPPAPATGPATGNKGTLKVTTDPPAAAVWLLLGRGRVTFEDAPAKRYFIKAILAGHEPAFLSLSEEDFSKSGGVVTRALKLDPLAATSAPDAAKPPAAVAAPPPAVKAPATPKPRPRVRTPRRRPAKSSKPPRPRRPPPVKPTPAKPATKKKPGAGIAVPNWAR